VICLFKILRNYYQRSADATTVQHVVIGHSRVILQLCNFISMTTDNDYGRNGEFGITDFNKVILVWSVKGAITELPYG